MPTRLLRDWTDSNRTACISAEAERLLVRLIMKAEDWGRCEANPKLLRSILFPLHDNITDAHIGAWLTELADVDLVSLYSVEGKTFVQVERFGQRTRYPSRYPSPDAENAVRLSQTKSDLVGQSPPAINIHTHTPTHRQTVADDSRNDRGGVADPPSDGNLFVVPKKTRSKAEAIPADVEAVERFADEIDAPPHCAEAFFCHYGSRGWMTKSGAIKDWKLAFRGWVRRDAEWNPPATGGNPDYSKPGPVESVEEMRRRLEAESR